MLLLSTLAFAGTITLDDAWDAALQNSRELKLIHEQRLQSDTLKTQALALLGPKLVAGANYTLNQRETVIDFSESFPPDVIALIESFTGEPVDFGDPLVVNKKSYFDWNVSVVQPIFSGQALPLYKGAIATVRAGAATEQVMQRQVWVGVAQAYWGVVVAREGVVVAEQAVTNATKRLEQAELRVSVGTAAPQLKLQADIALARAQREYAGVQAQLNAAQSAFSALTGLPLDSELAVLPPHTLPYTTVEAAIESALDNRPDLVAAGWQSKAARAQQTGTTLSWLPSVDGRFTQSWSQNSGFSGEPYNWQVVLKADWVLWDGGARLAEQAKAASLVRMADTAAEKAAADAEIEVRTLWDQRDRAERAYIAVERELSLAEENARLADAAFEAGSLPFLDLEDARLGLQAAKLTRVAEQMNLDVVTIQLLAATGDLH